MEIRGIILAHSVLAQALISTVEYVLGPQEDLLPLSNNEFSVEDLRAQLRRYLEDGRPTLIFTDFVGGSTFAVARLAVESFCNQHHTACAVIAGVNLPMIISFATKRSRLPFPELVEMVREDGHRGIQ